MMRQQVTRRIILGAFTVALLLPASAAGEGPVFGPDDFGSRGDFEDLCDTGGGTFIDTEDGNTWCHFKDRQTVCDSEGNDCYTIHREDQEPSSPWGPTGPTDGVGPVDEGGTDPAPPVTESPAPEADDRTPEGATQKALAPDDESEQDHPSSKKGKKGKKGKHGKKGGKHGKR